jgi:Uma2 family endonuclease
MIVSKAEITRQPHFASFEDYLTYEDSDDRLYELFNGGLVEVPPESGINVGIATKLLIYFAQLVGHLRVRGHGLELEVDGEPRNRYPDLTIIKEEHIDQLLTRNTIRLNMMAPDLVVEVVSPGSLQRDRDYVAKRSQYQNRQIPTYWIIDPQTQEVMVLTLASEGYQEQIYREHDRLPFQDSLLSLTVVDVFATD